MIVGGASAAIYGCLHINVDVVLAHCAATGLVWPVFGVLLGEILAIVLGV